MVCESCGGAIPEVNGKRNYITVKDSFGVFCSESCAWSHVGKKGL